MNSHSCQHNIRNSLLFNRLACVWILFFFLATTSFALTTDWLNDVLSSVNISALDQRVEQAVVPLSPAESEPDFSDDLFSLAADSSDPVLCGLLACLTLLSVTFSFTRFDRWRAPACPRPPPFFPVFFS